MGEGLGAAGYTKRHLTMSAQFLLLGGGGCSLLPRVPAGTAAAPFMRASIPVGITVVWLVGIFYYSYSLQQTALKNAQTAYDTSCSASKSVLSAIELVPYRLRAADMAGMLRLVVKLALNLHYGMDMGDKASHVIGTGRWACCARSAFKFFSFCVGGTELLLLEWLGSLCLYRLRSLRSRQLRYYSS